LTSAPFFIKSHSALSGNNSAVECNLAKVEVAGSNPVSRSSQFFQGGFNHPFFVKMSLFLPILFLIMEHAALDKITTAIPKRKAWKDLLNGLYSHFCSKDHVYIVIDPDPDSIGAALAMKRLLWHKVASTTIGMIRPIRRLNNITMVRLLRLPLVPARKRDLDRCGKFILVDGQPSHNDFFSNIPFSAIIDHHPANYDLGVPFSDIRPEYGSTSTIMTQYLRAAKIMPSKMLATTLLYGIKTDTRSFERHTLLEDIEAFRYLFPFADHNILRKIEISDLSLRDLKLFHKAFERKHVIRDRIFAHLDEVPSADILVEIAEFMLKIHDISWSIISGTYLDSLIIIIRNDGYRKDAGKVVRRSFGSMGCAGGHQAMARAEIPLSHLTQEIGKLSSTSIERFVRRRLSPFARQ
jgi:nanoRNase/pAp phosphatase (c-di-AMP/oligoRNAs hydrolase)